MIPCNCCHELLDRAELSTCYVCDHEVCELCQVPLYDEEYQPMDTWICQSCADAA